MNAVYWNFPLTCMVKLRIYTPSSYTYIGYSPRFWYWEGVVLLRKLAMAAMAVFMSGASAYTQGLTALLIVFVALFLHLSASPYPSSKLNNLETVGLLWYGCCFEFLLHFYSVSYDYLPVYIMFSLIF